MTEEKEYCGACGQEIVMTEELREERNEAWKEVLKLRRMLRNSNDEDEKIKLVEKITNISIKYKIDFRDFDLIRMENKLKKINDILKED